MPAATLAMRRDEIERQWHLIDPIEATWADERPDALPTYAAGGEGPAAARVLARNGQAWRPLDAPGSDPGGS